MYKITDIVDNHAGDGFQAEHGLSLLIETRNQRILFDTGAGNALLSNSKRLGITLDDVTHIVLSHGHYDHTGGLAHLSPQVPIFVGRGIEEPCFSRHEDGTFHDITMPQNSKNVLDQSTVQIIDSITKIADGIYSSGQIPRVDATGKQTSFFAEASTVHPNDIPEEQALWLNGGILMTGCCHSGIFNTIEMFRKNKMETKTLIGGLHLLHADETELRLTADYLNSLSLERVILLHCTGDAACEYLKRTLLCEVHCGQCGETWKL